MPLYPECKPYDSGHLNVSNLHTIYWETCGNPNGLPVVSLHGGPGGGIMETDRRYFDPKVYRSVLFDQRGCGKSTPSASLVDNTTWHLVEDIEKLRKHLSIDRWVVFGGSWGSTLALAYAEAHPDQCLGLVLRGIFTLRKKELNFFYQEGANFLFPEFFAEYKGMIPEDEQGNLMKAYYKRLTGNDEEEKLACASAWSKWEMATAKLVVDQQYIERSNKPEWALAFARIECHYFVNEGWLVDGQLIAYAWKLTHLPITIIQGRYDIICPAITAYDLYEALGGSSNSNLTYKILPTSGHSAGEPDIEEELVKAADSYRSINQ